MFCGTKEQKHLMSAGADLKWFQLHLLDVYAVLFAPILLLLWLCKKCCCGRRKSAVNIAAKKSTQSKKNN